MRRLEPPGAPRPPRERVYLIGGPGYYVSSSAGGSRGRGRGGAIGWFRRSGLRAPGAIAGGAGGAGGAADHGGTGGVGGTGLTGSDGGLFTCLPASYPAAPTASSERRRLQSFSIRHGRRGRIRRLQRSSFRRAAISTTALAGGSPAGPGGVGGYASRA